MAGLDPAIGYPHQFANDAIPVSNHPMEMAGSNPAMTWLRAVRQQLGPLVLVVQDRQRGLDLAARVVSDGIMSVQRGGLWVGTPTTAPRQRNYFLDKAPSPMPYFRSCRPPTSPSTQPPTPIHPGPRQPCPPPSAAS